VAPTLEQKVATLQCPRREQQTLDSLRSCCAIAWIDRGDWVASGRRQQLA
jgi:hypothetical protein